MQQLRDNLYISDAQAVRLLDDDHDFDEVVTLGYMDSFGYDRPDASTTGDKFVFPDGDHDYGTFEAAVDYVLDALADGKKTVVHCQAGVSRSAGVCATVLSEWDDLDIQTALEQVHDARIKTQPAEAICDSMERYSGDSLSNVPTAYDI